MSVVQIVGFGAGYLVFLSFLLFVVRPKTQRQRIQVLINSVGLPLSSEMEPIVIANQKREVRAGFVGIVIWVVAASVGMILAGVTIPGEMFLIDFTSIIVFTGITIAFSTLIREHRRQDSGIRFARVRAVGIADYRDAFERWMPRIIVALALAAFALRAALSPSAFGLTAAFLYLYAVLTVVALHPSSGSASDAFGVRAEVRVVFAACALLLVSAIRSGLTKTGQRSLRRLWPELLAPVAAVPSSRAHA